VLLSIAGPTDMTLHEVSTAASMIADHSDGDANIIFGAIIDDALGDEMRVTVIAAGFERDRRSASRSATTGVTGTTGTSGPGGPSGTRPEPSSGDPDDVEIPGFVQG
jgi:cell division protein FtsZ